MGLLPSPPESLDPRGDDTPDPHPPSETLLEFRAGKMIMDGKRVHADPRKGVIRVVKAGDTLVHFQWFDYVANAMEDDQIVFPEEATFEKVVQSSGRVYILKFKHDDRKFFYWMQGGRAEEDELLCEGVKHHLNQPLYSDEDLEEAVPAETSGTVESREVPEASPMDAVGEGFFAGDGTPSSRAAVQMSDLQKILRDLGQGQISQSVDEGQVDTGPSFSDIFNPDVVLPLLDEGVLEERLTPYLPEGVKTLDALADLMRSPQFQQQLDTFTRALRSGQLDWAQFGVNPNNYNFTVSSFLEAMEDQTVSNPGSNPSSIPPQADSRRSESEQSRESQVDDQRTKNDNDRMEEG